MNEAVLSGNPDTLVIVPMYNEATVISRVLEGLHTRFSNVLVVDDGSSDGSGDLARAAGAAVVRHSTNLGQGASLRTGIEYALSHTSADYLVTFDADGQHRIEDTETMVAALRLGTADIVLGSRFLKGSGGMPRGRVALLKAGTLFTRLTTGLRVTDTHNGLRAFTRAAGAQLTLRQPGMAHGSEVFQCVARGHLRYCEHPVTVIYSDYARGKGQRGVNAINVLYDLAAAKVRLAR